MTAGLRAPTARQTAMALAVTYGCLAYLFILSPVAVLVVFSFQDAQLPIPPLQGLTLHWYRAVLADGNKMQALFNSITVGVLSSLASCAMGFLAAYGLARYPVRGAGLIRLAILAPANLSYLIVAMGLLIYFGQIGIPRSLFAVGLGHVVINLPVAFALIYSQIGAHQVNIERAARDLGAREWQVIALVVLPTMAPTLTAAFALCFSLSWDEFIIAFLLSQFDSTLPVEIWSSLRSGLNPLINAAGTLVFGLSMGFFLLAVAYFVTQRRLRRA